MNLLAAQWFQQKDWQPHAFQQATWKHIAKGKSGLLNAPTGFGKTMAVWFGVLAHYYEKTNPPSSDKRKERKLHCLWITPLRALSKEIHSATDTVSNELGLDYRIGLRTGDTLASERKKQKTTPPNALITTPESVHIMLATKGYVDYFGELSIIVVDEWHELMGSKRGVLVELALSRLKALNPKLIIWGISATIGNLKEAKNILLGNVNTGVLVRADIDKKIEVHTILPDTLEKFPWAGHMGLSLAEKVLPLIRQGRSTLLFTNTRAQAEIWYHHLLSLSPELAGVMALHHGSLSQELRNWVEEALHDGILKLVVCTSSLDLGVDFRPVDTVIQVGSPKGIARFLQRAGRSGHQPGALSTIYFLPTHSLEIMEGASLKYAVSKKMVEDRIPFIRSFDILIQYLLTLAVSEGFNATIIFEEVIKTHCYQSISREEFDDCLLIILKGGKTLDAYDEFYKLEKVGEIYKVTDKRIALRHRLSIGTIVSDAMMQVKFLRGTYLGSIEEWFISRLKPGDTFWFSGRSLELVRVKHMQVLVRASQKKRGAIPSWMGGRFPISVNLGAALRHIFKEVHSPDEENKSLEVRFLAPLFDTQSRKSYLPKENELLIEYIQTKYGHHLFIYTFEGKFVHEGMAAVLAYRLSKIKPLTFSIATNEYGIELLSDETIPISDDILAALFSLQRLHEDIQHGINTTEMARRQFREIAGISGLVFKGYPKNQLKARHLQANAGLFFSVFEDYEKDNLLLRQAYDEVFTFQLEISRMYAAFQRIATHKIVLKTLKSLSPFSFPLFTESFRQKYSNEDWRSRIEKIKRQLEQDDYYH